MKDFIRELRIQQEEYRLYCDNQSAIHLAKNVVCHLRTKDIQRRYHQVRERVEDKDFALLKIHMNDNGLDMPMKVLCTERLSMCQQRVRLVNQPIPREGGVYWENCSLQMGRTQFGYCTRSQIIWSSFSTDLRDKPNHSIANSIEARKSTDR